MRKGWRGLSIPRRSSLPPLPTPHNQVTSQVPYAFRILARRGSLLLAPYWAVLGHPMACLSAALEQVGA